MRMVVVVHCVCMMAGHHVCLMCIVHTHCVCGLVACLKGVMDNHGVIMLSKRVFCVYGGWRLL